MKKGTTLVELIIAIAIFAIAMVGITYVYLAAWNTRAINTLKQSNEQFSEIISEDFNNLIPYIKLNDSYAAILDSGCSKWKYFNNKSDIDGWFTPDGTGEYAPISAKEPQDDENSYTKPSDKKYGAFIKIQKVNPPIATGVTTYHIYIKVIQLDKGNLSKSVKDIYESGN